MLVLIILGGALCSTCGTLAIQRSANFRKVLPTALAFLFYGGSTWFLALAMAKIPVAFAHAAWSAIVALLLLGADLLYLKRSLTLRQIAGFFSILSGIVLLSGAL